MSVATPDSRPSRLRATRSAPRIARAVAARAARPLGRTVAYALPVLDQRLDSIASSSAANDLGQAARPQTTPGSLSSTLRPAAIIRAKSARLVRSPRPMSSASARRDHVVGGALDLLPHQLHCSSSGSCPWRRTTCEPPVRGSSIGKSARKWPPRLSWRCSAHSATSRGTSAEALRSRSQSGGVADQARVLPHLLAQLAVNPIDLRGAALGRSRVETERRVRQRRERGAPAEDEALEQRVRREPVGAVDARAGALAGRVEPGHDVLRRRGR